MKKISFSLLIFLMTTALTGIILVQSFWIKTTIDTKERQFSLNVNQALKSVADDIKSREYKSKLTPCSSNIPSTPKIDIVIPSTRRIAIFVPKKSAILIICFHSKNYIKIYYYNNV